MNHTVEVEVTTTNEDFLLEKYLLDDCNKQVALAIEEIDDVIYIEPHPSNSEAAGSSIAIPESILYSSDSSSISDTENIYGNMKEGRKRKKKLTEIYGKDSKINFSERKDKNILVITEDQVLLTMIHPGQLER